jgi:hypothetical protein
MIHRNENDMDINNKRPEDVLKLEFVQVYQNLHKDIWGRLIHVNTNLTILEKIQNFPFHHIYSPQGNIFWTMVYWNFLYISIIFLHTLTTDEGDQKHTLRGFANKIRTDWISDSYKSEYQKHLKNAKLDRRLEPIRTKIKKMRDKVIAHRFLDSDGARVIDVKGVKLTEIRQAYEDIEKLFRVCSFGVQYISNFYIGGTIGGKPVKEDIDELLELILKNSYWLNEPEREKDFWPTIRERMSGEDIAELNEFRKKFGMPPA